VPPEPPPPPQYPPTAAYGAPMPYQYQGQRVLPRSAWLAVVASFIIPGLGSMINGRVGKGILILFCAFLAALSSLIIIGFILAPAVWIWGMVAANNDVRKWNAEHGIVS
jgi:TM2 domain-containing membrane protein YozV